MLPMQEGHLAHGNLVQRSKHSLKALTGDNSGLIFHCPEEAMKISFEYLVETEMRHVIADVHRIPNFRALIVLSGFVIAFPGSTNLANCSIRGKWLEGFSWVQKRTLGS